MENIPTYLIGQGILGVACLVLGFVILKLYNSREEDRKVYQEEIKRLNDLRLKDTVDLNDRFVSVVERSTENTRILTEKIESGKERSR